MQVFLILLSWILDPSWLHYSLLRSYTPNLFYWHHWHINDNFGFFDINENYFNNIPIWHWWQPFKLFTWLCLQQYFLIHVLILSSVYLIFFLFSPFDINGKGIAFLFWNRFNMCSTYACNALLEFVLVFAPHELVLLLKHLVFGWDRPRSQFLFEILKYVSKK